MILSRSHDGGTKRLNREQIANDAAWDGLHAIDTNERTVSARELLARYRRLWVIEESFRTLSHGMAVRPICHFKPERVAAHNGLCYLAFAHTRHPQQRIKPAQTAMSVQRIRAALHGVQASILEHKTTRAKYRLPRAFGHDAVRIHKAFGLKRNLDVKVDRSEARRNARHHTTGTHSGASGSEVRSAQHAVVVDSK